MAYGMTLLATELMPNPVPHHNEDDVTNHGTDERLHVLHRSLPVTH